MEALVNALLVPLLLVTIVLTAAAAAWLIVFTVQEIRDALEELA